MFCPKCGVQIPDGSTVCNSCGASLIAYSSPAQTTAIKTSGWAIASLVCAILSPLTCFISGLLAIIFGIVALVNINKSRGNLKGNGMAISGIVIPIIIVPFIAILLSILMPALAKVRILSQRVVCGSHMNSIGKELMIYANDNNDKYPATDKWCDLLLENSNISKKVLICPGAPEGPCDYAMNKNIEKIGPLGPSDLVLLFETDPGWNQSGDEEILSTENHKGDGCNILFNDGHVEFVLTENLSRLKWKPD